MVEGLEGSTHQSTSQMDLDHKRPPFIVAASTRLRMFEGFRHSGSSQFSRAASRPLDLTCAMVRSLAALDRRPDVCESAVVETV